VLGSGIAGCVSAIEAYDTDPSADVLIVEKMPEALEGGNSRVSGQQLCSPTPPDDPETVEKLIAYQQALDQPNPVPEGLRRRRAEAMVNQRSWIARMASEVGRELVVLRQKGAPRRSEFANYPGAAPEFPGTEIIVETYTIAAAGSLPPDGFLR